MQLTENKNNCSEVDNLLENAKKAFSQFRNADQQRVDEAVTAVAWSLYEDSRARLLAELAVKTTGLGNVNDKIIKNQRKTFGTLRDLMRARTVGIIEDDPAKGLVKYAKPVGIVAAITPSTNPVATPVNKCMMVLKGRNAIIIAPSPAGWAATSKAVEMMREQLRIVGEPQDLIQVLPHPVSRESTKALMASVDLVVATGSQNNVRGAYSSGTPAIGVGVGNVPVIIDETANFESAARLIGNSKTFDNGTSCSSENSVIIVNSVYDKVMQEFHRVGGYLASADEREKIISAMWPAPGKLNRDLLATDAEVLIRKCGLNADVATTRFIIVEETGIGSNFPLSGEKLSLVLTAYRASDFNEAVKTVNTILAYQGAGHSCGIHTSDLDRARTMAENLDVVRVLVNQAHTFGNGGGFTSGLPFTLSMGCGTWGGNSISENLNYRHFINITHLATEIPEDKPSEASLFGEFLDKYHPNNN